MEQIKAVASILNEMKTSVMLMLLLAWLAPQIGGFVVLWAFATRLADSFELIGSESAKQTKIMEDHRDNTTKLAKWMQDDERRDSILHQEMVRYLQENKR